MTAQLLALESHYTVTAAGAGCEFVANNVVLFLQNLVDNIRLNQYVELRDLLIDDIYVLGKQDILGMDVCPHACLSDRFKLIPYPH